MATAVKTWTWDSSTESFSLTAGSDSTYVRDTAQGSPNNGSLRHVTSGRNKAGTSYALLSGVTWEGLGVPAGSTVTHVQVTDIRTYYGLTNWNTVDLAGPVTVYLRANGTSTNVTGSTAFNRAASASQDGSWQSGSGTNQAVNASYQASTTSLDVRIEQTGDLGNGGSAAVSVHVDYLQLTITYTAASHTATGTLAGTAPTITGSASHLQRSIATGALAGQPPTITGEGDHTEPTVNPEGTGALTVPSGAIVGAGAQEFASTGAVTVTAPVVAGSATAWLTGIAEVSLGAVTDPGTDENHSIAFRARVQSGTGDFYAALYEGATNRSGDLGPTALSTALANYSTAIGTAQAAAITDYSDLSIRFWGLSPEGATFEVDYIALKLPESGAAIATGALVAPAGTIAGSGSALNTHAATGALTAPSATIAGTGAQEVSATGALTGAAPAIAGAGAETFAATGALTGQPPAVAGSGEELFAATGAIAVPAPLISGSGVEEVTSTGAIVSASVVISGAGTAVQPFVATGALTAEPPLIVGSGTHLQEITGTGEVTVLPPVITAFASFGNDITGFGALAGQPPLISGSGLEELTSTGALTVPAGTVAGTGDHMQPLVATGAVTVSAPVIVGSGDEAVTGTGAVTVEPPVITGTGQSGQDLTATGAISASSPTIVGAGLEEMSSTGTVVAEPPTVSGAGTYPLSGTGAVTSEPPVISGLGTLGNDIFAISSVTGQPPAVAGAGALEMAATGAITGAAPIISGSAAERMDATGALEAEPPAIVGSGSEELSGSGDVIHVAPVLSGAGVFVISGSGAITAPMAAILGDAVHKQDVTGTGALVAEPPVITATGQNGELQPSIGGGYGRRLPYLRQPPPPRPVITGSGALIVPQAIVRGAGRHDFDDLWLFLDPAAYLAGVR